MIELYDFQQKAADQLAGRVIDYIDEPATQGRGANKRSIPFVQFLSSITASGKTVILADAVAQIAALTSTPPVVLWISRLTVVVEQTLANLEPGGAYHDLINTYEVRGLSELSGERMGAAATPFLYFATTGTFNIRGKEGRKVFDAWIDKTDKSIWDSLRIRADEHGHRRPFVVVYDEAHNLSDQQTGLLLGLEPDAFLLSTATSRMPPAFQTAVVEPLKTNGEMTEEDLNTVVPAADVAKSELVKERLDLIGRQGPMEDVVAEMVDEMRVTQVDADAAGLPGQVKAIYVCRTNITEGDDRRRDEPRQPFNMRQAPPILIWRHLVEGLGVDPATIAAYCDLKVDKHHPLPSDFTLFKGGEKDYAALVAGDYQHIIFNQSLEEGWDDPFVYFAYIDKTLGSTIAAEQIVGRLLRQPGRKHYTAPRLNGAQLFIRVESNKVFDEVVAKTQDRLQGEGVPVTATRTGPGTRNRRSIDPKMPLTVPDVATHTADAIEAMAELVAEVPNYRNSGESTTGIGKRTKVQRVIGSREAAVFAWEEVGTSSRVSARWLFSRALRRFHRDAAASVSLDDAKWDALIGLGSPAASILEQYAERVGSTFISDSYIEVADEDDEDFVIGPALVREEGYQTFEHAAHAGYSDLNPTLEKPFAFALEKLKQTWARNPSRSGFGIPLIKQGGNDTFYPDFIVWAHGDVYVIDTKGSHLLADAMRKLVRVRQAPGRPRIQVRFVVEGHLDLTGNLISQAGYTVMGFKPDGDVSYATMDNLDRAAAVAIRRSP